MEHGFDTTPKEALAKLRAGLVPKDPHEPYEGYFETLEAALDRLERQDKVLGILKGTFVTRGDDLSGLYFDGCGLGSPYYALRVANGAKTMVTASEYETLISEWLAKPEGR